MRIGIIRKRKRLFWALAVVLVGLGTYLWFTRTPALGKPPVVVWSRASGKLMATEPVYMLLDGNGGVYIAGYTRIRHPSMRSVEREPCTGCVAQYSDDGKMLWSKEYPCRRWGAAPVVGPDGCVYVVSSRDRHNGGMLSARIKRIDSRGEWLPSILVKGNYVCCACAVDKSGSVYVSGYIDDGSGYNKAFLAKYGRDRRQVFEALVTGPGGPLIGGTNMIALDGDGGAYVLSYNNLEGGFTEHYMSRIDSQGRVLWSSKCDKDVSGLCSDARGNLCVVGNFSTSYYSESSPASTLVDRSVKGLQDWNGKRREARSGDCDAFVEKIDKKGKSVWSQSIVTQWADVMSAVTTDAQGNVYAAGISESSKGRFFVRKYDTDGKPKWVKRIEQYTQEFPAQHSMAVDKSGDIYLSFSDGYAGGHVPVVVRLRQR